MAPERGKDESVAQRLEAGRYLEAESKVANHS